MKKKLVTPSIVVVAVLLAGVFLMPWLKSRVRPAGTTVLLQKEGATHRLLVNGSPYLIKGVCYSPIPVGKDYEYNFWGDSKKPWLLDGKLMKEMGVNTIRIYRLGKNPEEVRQVLSDFHRRFGIRAIVGHYLGFWSWPPPNYTDEAFKENIKTEVLEMVRLYKDHPAILMWVLGNENNYSFDRDVQRWSSDALDALSPEAKKKEMARIYYSFVNDLAKEIKKIDPHHPVVMGMGEVKSLDIAAQYAPDIDVIGMIAYRGPGFGSLFRQIRQKLDKPVVMIEWGADSYNALQAQPDEEAQADFLKLQWQDIERNADPKKGSGNALGGTLFEWSDEWWKGNENLPYTWSVHDTAGHWGNASYYTDADVLGRLNMNEEWWGVVSIERKPKKSYPMLKALWE
ncbi:MAG: hypothetical protein HY592_00725 [Candidatus Omnitrophica bacterium]|nr:hypothetical protein [Candidatus Omnitrophota bacterium]